MWQWIEANWLMVLAHAGWLLEAILPGFT